MGNVETFRSRPEPMGPQKPVASRESLVTAFRDSPKKIGDNTQ